MRRGKPLSPVLITGGAASSAPISPTGWRWKAAGSSSTTIYRAPASRTICVGSPIGTARPIQVMIADVRNYPQLRRAVAQARSVFHLAAQVAVTTSLVDPRSDFEINVGGTLNLARSDAGNRNRRKPGLHLDQQGVTACSATRR